MIKLRCRRELFNSATLLLAALFFYSTLTGCGGSSNASSEGSNNSSEQNSTARSFELRVGLLKTPVPDSMAPIITQVDLPSVSLGEAIWGATGRTDNGRLFLGFSSEGGIAELAELTDIGIELRGSVIAKLKETGVYKNGERQEKIHSKFIEADDGYLYFASMSISGEKADGSRYPTWGGHVWRLNPVDDTWEHVFDAREALLAVTGNGRYVYALGYFQHAVFQYDTKSDKTRHVVVGSVGGQVSRNFMCDIHGHVFVPRVAEVGPEAMGTPGVSEHEGRFFKSWLVELTPELTEVQAIPLDGYDPSPDFENHGIVGYTHLTNNNIVFATHTGALYLIEPNPDSLAQLKSLGPFRPDGEQSYPSSLFTFQGERYVCGHAGNKWIVWDLNEGSGKEIPLSPESREMLELPSLLLYGTHTKDKNGDLIMVGRYQKDGGLSPIILRASFNKN